MTYSETLASAIKRVLCASPNICFNVPALVGQLKNTRKNLDPASVRRVADLLTESSVKFPVHCGFQRVDVQTYVYVQPKKNKLESFM